LQTPETAPPLIETLRRRLIEGQGELSRAEALAVLQLPDEQVPALAALAGEVKAKYAEAKTDLCAIINAKSGHCCEDCGFCSQSARFKTEIKAYPMLPKDAMLQAAHQAVGHLADEADDQPDERPAMSVSVHV